MLRKSLTVALLEPNNGIPGFSSLAKQNRDQLNAQNSSRLGLRGVLAYVDTPGCEFGLGVAPCV